MFVTRGLDWNRVKLHLSRIVKVIRYYEVKEATTLFELAMWKAKINQEEAQPINREACRIEVPGPVKDIISNGTSKKHRGNQYACCHNNTSSKPLEVTIVPYLLGVISRKVYI